MCVCDWTKEKKVCVSERERLDQREDGCVCVCVGVCVRERDWTKEKKVCVCVSFMSGRLCSLLYPPHRKQGMHKESLWKRFTDR